MATLDTIKQLRQQGYQDADIISNLQQQGIPPREINEAMAQSQVKQAVADETTSQPFGQAPQQTQEVTSPEGMQPSLLNQPQTPQQPKLRQPEQPLQAEQPPYSPPPTQQPPQAQQPLQAPYPQGETPEYEQGPVTVEQGEGYDQGYDEFGQGYSDYSYAPADTDTITEIANQIIADKTKKIDKNMNTIMEFKTLLAAKVEKLDDRLKKIEAIIDQLQMSLIRKSSDQEQNISDIKAEMRSMQDSFGKIINPLVDNIREIEEKKPKKRTHKTKKAKTTKKKTTKKKKRQLLL